MYQTKLPLVSTSQLKKIKSKPKSLKPHRNPTSVYKRSTAKVVILKRYETEKALKSYGKPKIMKNARSQKKSDTSIAKKRKYRIKIGPILPDKRKKSHNSSVLSPIIAPQIPSASLPHSPAPSTYITPSVLKRPCSFLPSENHTVSRILFEKQEWNEEARKLNPYVYICSRIVPSSQNNYLISLKPDSTSRLPQIKENMRSSVEIIKNPRINALNRLNKLRFPSLSQYEAKFGKLRAVLFQPRKMTSYKEIIIINFEGIIGDFIPKIKPSYSQSELFFRSDVLIALKELQFSYQLVIVSATSMQRFIKVLNIISSNEIYLSGAYRLTPGSTPNNRRYQWMCNYGRIINDFLPSEQKDLGKVLIVSAVTIDPQEAVSAGELHSETETLRPDFHVLRAPVPDRTTGVPVTLLLPHIQLSTEPLGFDNICKVIHALLKSRSFITGYQLHSIENVGNIETSKIIEQFLVEFHEVKAHEIRESPMMKDGKSSDIGICKGKYMAITSGTASTLSYISQDRLSSTLR